MTETAMVLFSGGQDSATCLAWALDRFDHVETIAFDYGQTHAVELEVRTAFIAALKERFPEWGGKYPIRYFIGDIRDYHSISSALIGVDYVFHAAAFKQVPSCEFYPMQAVKTNIIGAENVLEAAYKHKVSKVIMTNKIPSSE